MTILNNTTSLQSLLEQANALPDAGGGGNLIIFTLTSYQLLAYENMTWAEWVTTKFNVQYGALSINMLGIKDEYYIGYETAKGTRYVYLNDVKVLKTDIIQQGAIYSISA